jgi:regulatory protein YycH of two-component signal transduction system YycFG
VYQTALDAQDGGREITFDQLMLSTDDAEEKNLLVACDESGQEKTDSDTAQRVRDLIRRVEDEQNRSRRSAQLAVFHKKTLEVPQEDEELNRLFQDLAKSQQSRRQAGSSPTEG